MKPIQAGELCVVVRSRTGKGKIHIGAVIRVVERSKQNPDAWRTKPSLMAASGLKFVWVDASLHPIRPPSPTTETATEREKATS